MFNNKITFHVKLYSEQAGVPIYSKVAMARAVCPALKSIGINDCTMVESTDYANGVPLTSMVVTALVDNNFVKQADILHVAHTIATVLCLPSVTWSREVEVGNEEFVS